MQISSVSDVGHSHVGRRMAMVAHMDNNRVIMTGSKVEFSDTLRGMGEWKGDLLDHSLTDDVPGKLYMYFDDQGNESMVVRPDGSNAVVSFCNLSDRSSECVDLEMQSVHEVTQTEDGRRLLMLNDDRVSVVDLWQRKTVEHINYDVNFRSIANLRRHNSQWMHPHSLEGKEMSERRISEDGRTVLIAWDMMNKRSIVVKPATSYFECQAMIANAKKSLSDYCLLSRNAEVTLFVDVDELMNGHLVIGFFNESRETQSLIISMIVFAVRRVVRYIKVKDVESQIFSSETKRILQSVFYDLTPDGTTLITAIAHNDARVQLEPCVETFGVNCSETYIGSYAQLISDPIFDAKTSALQLFARHGVSVFDILGSRGMTLFQEAIRHRHWEFTEMLQEIAWKNNIPLSLYHSSAAAKAEFNDFLKGLFESESTNDIYKVIELICSKTTPFDQVVRGMTVAFDVFHFKHPDIVWTMLSKDILQRRMCELRVHVNFMDLKLRQDAAVHIDTSDEYKIWTTIRDPSLLGQRFREQNENTVRQMEKIDSSTTKAVLIYICIKDAAKVGMKGIIRPLLMQNALPYIFNLDVVKWVIMYKWMKIWKARSIKKILFYCLFLLTFTIYVLLLGRSDALFREPDWTKALSTGVLSVTFIFGCRMLKEEISQAKAFIKEGHDQGHGWKWGLHYHFVSRWNCMDLISCLVVIILLPLFHGMVLNGIDVERSLSAIVAVEAILASLKMWYFAQPFRGTGALVLLINNVVTDCLAFLLLTFLILFGFALALHVLYRHAVKGIMAEEVHDAFGTFGNSLVTLFYAMLGNFEPDVIRSAGDLFWLVIVIFGMFLVTETLVLLNLLIALMGDTFDRVKNTEEDQLLMGRAIFIDSCEAALSTSEIEQLNKEIGEYVWVLMPADEQVEMDPNRQWMGRMTMLKTTFESAIKESGRKLREWFQQQMKQPEAKLEAMSIALTEKITMNTTRFEGLEAKIEAMSIALNEKISLNTVRLEDLEAKIEELNRQNSDQFVVLKSLLEHHQDPQHQPSA